MSGNSEGTFLGWEVLCTERLVISAGDKGDDGFDSDDSVSSPLTLLKTSFTAKYLRTIVCSSLWVYGNSSGLLKSHAGADVIEN